ncbi:MAG: dual CXXC motif small (seleno)protein [Syntrophobacteria bacterium]
MRCGSCGTRYPLEKFPQAMDDDLEAEVSNIRCDRF